nr:hypothetical protein [Tanacetum cinerariifolium]GEY66881.1 hypothetical protein [Tanacetum cinerariifolium]
MDEPNITMEYNIMLEEEKAHRRGKVYNWKLLRMMSSENGVNPPALNPLHNSNFSLLSVLGRERLTGPNYMDWMRNLRFTLRYKNKEYVLDEKIPTINDDSTQEEIEAHQKHYDDAFEMNQQLKEMFQAKASKECLDVVKSLMACKLKPEASICAFVLEMKGYFDRKERFLIPTGKERPHKETPIVGLKEAKSDIAPTSDPKEAVCFYCNKNSVWKLKEEGV